MDVLVINIGAAYGADVTYNAVHGGEILCCGTCMDARGVTGGMLVENARRSTMDELATLTLAADKTIVF